METKQVLGIDVGLKIGRGVLGEFTGNKITLKEVYRFPTNKIRVHSYLYWDPLYIFSEIKKIISLTKTIGKIEGIGITTQSDDFGFVDKKGLLLSNPFVCEGGYQDKMVEEILRVLSCQKFYEKTGLPSLSDTSLLKLYFIKKEFPHLLDNAKKLLFMSDILNFFLTGEEYSEYTLASVSGMYNSNGHGQARAPRGNWNYEILENLNLNPNILPDVLSPGSFISNISKDIQKEISCGDIPIYSVCSINSASAVLGIPASENLWAYIFSNIRSSIGVEIENPIINEESYNNKFSNEGGYGGSIRFLKNIPEFMIFQKCREEWIKEGKEYSYSEILGMADKSKPFKALIDVGNDKFFLSDNVVEEIQSFCQKSGQEIPEEVGSISRVIFESLAMEYKYLLENLENLVQNKIEMLHIIGENSQNNLFAQFVASATKKTVMAGPEESVLAGNILLQMMAKKEITDLFQLRSIVKNSFPIFVYQPRETSHWDQYYGIYKKLKDVNQKY